MSPTGKLIENMRDIGFMGVTWALYDFGTGYSSMAYLSALPLSKIKLDKSFTMDLGKNEAALPILHSVSELCRGLSAQLLCEGVETSQQPDLLLREGCAEGQGHFSASRCL